ncbi:hypothetical protein ACX80L_15720 [Arthrobacter sp. MDT1-48-3]
MNTRFTSIAAALVAGGLLLTATGCAGGEPADAPATNDAASPSAEAATPVRPDTVLLDMAKAEIDPALIEAYADPAVGTAIGEAAEEFIRVGLGFPELQKGSHELTAADTAAVAPLRPLVSDSYWTEVEESFSSGTGTAFPPTLSDGVTLNAAEDPADNGHYDADDSGVTFVFRNDDMSAKYMEWENGATGVTIENLLARLMFTTTDGEIVYLDRTLYLTMTRAEDGTWDVWEYDGTIDREGLASTQAELDALPPI